MKENENTQIREIVLILLLINDGKTYQEIAKFLGISYPTVADWAVHGDPDKMASFIDGRSQGNFRKATPKYEEVLLEVVEKEPLEYG
jgi:transposase